MAIELVVPSVGESITEVEIGEWLKEPGDSVDADEPVVEIESEKATVEIFAPASGTITEIVKKTGEEAKVGDVVGYMEEGEAKPKKKADKEDTDEEDKRLEAKSGESEKETQEKEPEKESAAETAAVMPAAQRLADEHGIDPSQISGTGKGGRVLKEDVQKAVDENGAAKEREAAPVKPHPPVTEGAREEEAVRLSPMRRTIARTLVQAQQEMALLTTFNEIDMSEVVRLRGEYKDDYTREYGIKLGFMSFFVKACIEGLKAFPAVNAEIRGDEAIYKNYYDIGIAVGGGRGLVVPVIRNAERLSFAEIELTIADFGRRAQDNKVTPEELQGGTFTITNGGIYGSMLSTPIINPPQSGILGMHAIEERAVVRNGEIVIRPMMYVALTYDHRIVDGREAVSFLVRLKECIENPTRILLEI